jgi:hypothetical protein
LVRDQRIGNEEIKAAAEILSVFMTISGSLLSGSMLRDRVSGGRGDQSLWVIEAHERYKVWADHWSVRKKRGDPTLERPFRQIERDLRLRNGRAAGATVNGLPDSRRRAGAARECRRAAASQRRAPPPPCGRRGARRLGHRADGNRLAGGSGALVPGAASRFARRHRPSAHRRCGGRDGTGLTAGTGSVICRLSGDSRPDD